MGQTPNGDRAQGGGLIRALIYGFGQFGTSLASYTVTLWFMFAYAPPTGPAYLPISMIGTAMAIGRFFNAVSNPLAGYFSDRLKSPWGRRKPFILLGGAMLAVAFYLVWLMPALPTEGLRFLYLALVLSFFFAMYTATVTPYLGLLAEITKPGRERLHFSMSQTVFMMLGSVLAVALSSRIVGAIGYSGMGLLFAAGIALSFIVVTVGVSERADQPPASPAVSRMLRELYGNLAFRYFLGADLLSWFGLNMMVLATPYLATVLARLSETDVGIVAGGALLGIGVFLFPMQKIVDLIGKKRAYFYTLVLMGVLVPMFRLIGTVPDENKKWVLLGAFFLSGLPMSAFMTLPNAILADVAEADARRSGEGKQGFYFGVGGFFGKLTLALSALFCGNWLERFGFTVEKPGGLLTLPYLSGLILLLAAVSIWFYPEPLTREEGT